MDGRFLRHTFSCSRKAIFCRRVDERVLVRLDGEVEIALSIRDRPSSADTLRQARFDSAALLQQLQRVAFASLQNAPHCSPP